ncbi:MAG: 4-hydroxybenzoate octaprenyltransferase [Woeseiaceae bacterium]|nr:4-hydroxybenzoate octaprenyltransferase [Woeseiaceae bacterium]
MTKPSPQTAGRIPPGILNQLQNYVILMRMDRPIGVLLLMWPTLWALWLAGEGHPDDGLFIVFVLGVIVMRAAGCVLNDFADRNIDPYVERTRDRPIPAGHVAPLEAFALFVALGLIAIGLASLLNRPAQLLAGIAAVLAIIYPFVKRFLSIPQFFLGAAFGWAVPMVFAAQTGRTPQLAWLLFGAALIWAIIYDTFYAMVDRDDDLKIGVKSTAILFGELDLFSIAALQGLMLFALLLVGNMAALGPWYYASLFVAALLMGWHQWLARNRDRPGCFRAFLHNHYIGMVVFIGIVLNYTFDPVVPA